MKNVLVLAIGGERFAVELRWIREIITLGPVTPVPGAPAAIAGAVNVHGTIVPVLHGAHLLSATLSRKLPAGRAPRAGDSAAMFDVEDLRVALAVERVDEVTTLDGGGSGGDAEGVLKGRDGREVTVLDPAALCASARRLVALKAGAGAAEAGDDGR